jgi:hypothetical protein
MNRASRDRKHRAINEVRMVSNVPTTNDIELRLRRAASLPQVLSASFEAFEAIRITARDYEGRAPELFAAFMTTADAAVDGREALASAPSLPLDGAVASMVTAAGTGQAADILAALAALLRQRLTDAAGLAGTADDRIACQDAADAAARIWQLMARGHDTRLR